MNLQSIFGGINIGKDITGNFRQSLKGLAVRRPDDKFVTLDGNSPIEVSDFTFDGTEQYVYRLPIPKVKPGDLIVTSENPFNALFVRQVQSNGHLIGVDPSGIETNYAPATNLFNVRFFVRVVSLLEGLNGSLGTDDLSPLLLLSTKINGGTTDSLTTLLLLQTLNGKTFAHDSLLPLFLLNSGGDLLETMLLLQAQGDQKNPFEKLFGHKPRRPKTDKVKYERQRKAVQK